MNNPGTWTDTDWARHDAALHRLLRRSADQFARDLDLLGWMIVPQPQHAGTGRWSMSFSGPCPDWAEPFDPPDGPPTKPTLWLIEGGKPSVG
jgi:hypothetical protein